MFLATARAGESALTATWQPLDGLGSGEITIVSVTCHHWFSSSAGSSVDLIALRNVPPTDNPERATEDLNLASVCGLRFSTSDLGDPEAKPFLALDATRIVEEDPGGYERASIVRASLECLRRCRPDVLRNIPVTLKCRDTDKEWLGKIVEAFNAHPQDQPFFKPEE